MIPNKTNEQILYQQFKFFDLDSTGYCALQNFIRVQNRIGVVLPKIKDFEFIFNYFADPETFLLDYKKFCKEIFNFRHPKQIQEENDLIEDTDFVSILINKILAKNGPFTLLDIIKNLQIIDFEGNKRLNSDEFLTALQRSGIKLESKDITSLFSGYDFFISGIVKYQLFIDILLEQFWDEKKNSLSEEIFFILTNGGRRQMSLNDIKNYFDKILEDSPDKKNLLNFIDKYKIINKNRINQNLILPDLIKFLQFYGFGENSYNFLENMLHILEPDIPKETNNYNNINNLEQKIEPKKKIKYNRSIVNNTNEEIKNIFENIREKIFNYSRKTFFNFIKHFKYYDENSNDITIYNFSKVLKDFNLNLSIDEIEKMFIIYGFNKKTKTMNYNDFINDLISEFTDEKRLKIIRYIYDTIEERGNKFKRDIDLTFLKEVYNAKNNYFKKDETENRLEFEDCLELFHYIYKGNKNEIFNRNYFFEFYKCISFLIYSDIEFMKLISNEWRVPFEYIENEILGKNNQINDLENNEYIKEKNERDIKVKENFKNKEMTKNSFDNKRRNYEDNINIYPKKPKLIERLINNDFDNNYEENNSKSLSLLNSILKKRGLRGILYLHLEFINSCQDLSKISFNDFMNVIKIQHIRLSESDCKNIFYQFTSKSNKNYLDFSSFIRNFKIELNESKLASVEEAFNKIDINGNDRIPLTLIKKQFKAEGHPDLLNGKKNEEEIILEFLDCFNINYEILNLDSKSLTSNNCNNLIDFEIFANFYEYVSFIYPDDKEFDLIVSSSWN